jgi:hypothetical protein
VDSNHGRRKPADLQSAPFGHFGISPEQWWPRPESNRRHTDFQSVALPTELPGRKLVGEPGFEPRLAESESAGLPLPHSPISGGEGGIRTHGGFLDHTAFRERHLQPLGHLSNYGADGRTRTDDLLITNQLLYRLSYTSVSPSTGVASPEGTFGGPRRTRTYNLPIKSRMLYH